MQSCVAGTMQRHSNDAVASDVYKRKVALGLDRVRFFPCHFLIGISAQGYAPWGDCELRWSDSSDKPESRGFKAFSEDFLYLNLVNICVVRSKCKHRDNFSFHPPDEKARICIAISIAYHEREFSSILLLSTRTPTSRGKMLLPACLSFDVLFILF